MSSVKRRPGALSWALRVTLALAITVGALWWAFRGVDLSALVKGLAESDPWIICIYVLAQFTIHVVRVFRWELLIRPLGAVSRRAIFSSASVGLPAALFLPLRLGELVRPVMIARAGVPFGGAMASVVAERLADGLTNVALFFLLLAFLPSSLALTDELRLMSRLAAVGFGGACLILVIVAIWRRQALALLQRLLAPIAPGFAQRLLKLFDTFVDGLAPLSQPSRLMAFVALTAVYWGINGGMTTVLARSYGIDMPFLAGPFTVVIVVFAVTLPAGPAFTGTMQAGFRLALAPFGVTAVQAALVGTAAYLTQILAQTLILLVGLLAAEPGQRPRLHDVPAEPA